MNSILTRLIWLGILMLMLQALPAFSASFVTTAVADTSIYQNHPDDNLGGTTLVSGTNNQYSDSRALFRFDVSALPANAVVTSVQVSLYVTRQPDPDQQLLIQCLKSTLPEQPPPRIQANQLLPAQ